MKYAQAIDYLYKRLPVYQRQGATAIKKDLTNIKKLCDHLHNPERDFKSIHVAGTNGKGTVSHLIAAMLQTAGLKVGLYTSPHYRDFRERIKINGDFISEDKVVRFLQDQKEYIEEIAPSFFEVTVAMAFEYFRDEQVDIAVIETGLGGRLDSTNIIHPELSVITHISLDHTNMLGDNIYQIAGEKAGIIKENTPVVIGKHQSSCDHVFYQKARQENAPITFADHQWRYHNDALHHRDGEKIEMPASIRDESPFMIENVTTAIEAIHQLKSRIDLSKINIKQAVDQYRALSYYIGRWQILQQNPTVVTDSAHNPDAIQKVMNRLRSMPHQQLHLVLGFVGDKDVRQILQYMPHDANYYWVQPSIFRAMPCEKVAQIAGDLDLKGEIYHKVHEGLAAALQNAQDDDLIYVGGSSFVVGDLLEAQN